MKTKHVSHLARTALVIGVWLMGSVGGQCSFNSKEHNAGLAFADTATGPAASQAKYGGGEVLCPTGPMTKANPFRFSTKYQDEESDLLYYGYRYYNPSTGRWLSRDPTSEPGFEVLRHSRKSNLLGDGPNLYGFVRNNPPGQVDYLGLSAGDVMLLWQLFEAIIDDYCTKQIRCNCPTLGNVYASVPFLPNRGCTWQAINTHKTLLDEFLPHTDASWTLDTPNSGIIFRHNWVSAGSNNSNDPKVELDSWKGCITIKYAGEPPVKQCYHCDPFGRHRGPHVPYFKDLARKEYAPTWPNEGIN